jgi:hypothetical protein
MCDTAAEHSEQQRRPSAQEHTTDRKEQKDDRTRHLRLLAALLFFNIVCTIVMAFLVSRFGHLLNDAYDLTRTNHMVACHTDRIISGTRIYECQDIHTNSGGSK